MSSLSALVQSYNLDEEYQEAPVDDSDDLKNQNIEQPHSQVKEHDSQFAHTTHNVIESSSEFTDELDISQELDNFFAV